MTDAFKRLNNPELEKLKTANIKAKNLGPGVSQMTVDAFRLLKSDPVLTLQQEEKKLIAKEGLARKVEDLVK